MKESLLRQAAKLKQKNHDHKRWQKAVSILACVVVFCTVYALILPAVTMEKTAYCGKEEHTHTEDCYEKQLICGKEEGEGAHQHSDDCYQEEQVLVCPLEESEGHQHTDACYTEEHVLTCTNTDPDHEHNEFEGCYTIERVLTCGQETGEGAHHHTAECYETQKVLVCGQEENDGHHHTEECYKKELICQKEEHTHTLECYSNPEADVETEAQWSRTFANVTLTGDWAKDLTAIAETQTGYTESDRNYTVNADNTTNGYTRYGQWAGMPYADWSATFTSFCLYYANVPESAVPRNTGCEGWNSSAVSPNGYNPKEGDLILLDGNQDGTADHAGIVTSGSADSVTAIVGDSDKAVRRNTYSTSNAIITGYVPMPQNPALAEDEPEEPPTPEVTEEPEPTATPTPEVTEEPTATPTPEITEEPESTVTPIPEKTPTPEPEEIPEPTQIPVSDNKTEMPEDATSWCIAEIENSVSSESFSMEDNIALLAENNGEIDLTNMITNVTLERSPSWGVWLPVEDGKVYTGDTLRFTLNYEIPGKTLSDTENTVVYNLPSEIKIKQREEGKVYTSSGVEAGKYVIDTNGKISITFNDDFVEQNTADSEIKGYLKFESSASDIGDSSQSRVELPFKDDLKVDLNFEDRTQNTEDLQVTKEQTAIDEAAGTIDYTITVTSKGGTSSDVNLSDIMSNIALNGDITIEGVNQSQCTVSKDDKGFNITFPKMNAGDTYTITYKAKVTRELLEGTINTSNNVTVNSTNSKNEKLQDSSSVKHDFKRSFIKKKGVYDETTKKITWTIILNEDKKDLKGWTLSDILNGQEYTGDVNISPAIDGKTSITLPYKFEESTTETYTITYVTDADKEVGASETVNKAIMTPSDDSSGKVEASTGSGSYGNYNPLDKKADSIIPDANGETAQIQWTVTVDAKEGEIPAGWFYQDELLSDQYFTKDQLTDIYDKIKSQVGDGKYTLKAWKNNWQECDFADLIESDHYIGYKIVFNDKLEKGKKIEYTYTSTADIKNVTGEKTFSNNGSINKKVYSKDSIEYESGVPTIKKVDNRKAGTDTDHNYYDENMNGNGTFDMEWKITVTMPKNYKDGILKILEKLPEGVQLQYLGISASDLFEDIQNITSASNYSINGYVISTEVNGQDITVTIPEDMANNENLKEINLIVRVTPENADEWQNSKTEVKKFKNEVELQGKDGKHLGSDSQTQNISKSEDTKKIKKSAGTVEDNIIPYSIVVNPKGEDLLEGADTLTLKDELKPYYSAEYGILKASLVPNSLKVYERNADGSKGAELSADQCPYTFSEAPWDGSGNGWGYGHYFLNITIPDSKALIVEYKYKVTGNEKVNYAITNTVTMEGLTGDDTKDQNSINVTIQSSSAGADTKSLSIYKVDSDNAGIMLTGAKFKLYYWDGQEYQIVTDENGNPIIYTTETVGSSKGLIKLSDLKFNTAYKFEEIEAPTGYDVNKEPFYFYISNVDKTNYPEQKPEGFKGEECSGGTILYYGNRKHRTQINLKKVDSQDSDMLLNGAEFELYKWDKSIHQYVAVTDETGNKVIYKTQGSGESEGQVLIPDLEYNVAYRLIETNAPDGYEKLKDPLDFWIPFDDTTFYPVQKPEDFKGTAYSDTTGKGITIVCENTKKNAQIQVKKEWYDSDGNLKGDSSYTTSVTFNIYQKSTTEQPDSGQAKKVRINQYEYWSGISATKPDTDEYSVGTELTFKVTWKALSNNDNKIYVSTPDMYYYTMYSGSSTKIPLSGTMEDDKTKTFIYTLKLTDDMVQTGISVAVGNTNFTSENWVSFVCSASGNDDPFIPGTKFAGPYTISKRNGWIWDSTDAKDKDGNSLILPETGKNENGETVYYTYYVVEENGANYTFWKDENNNGIANGTIVLKNKETDTPQYELPETGGAGTNRFTAVGLSLMAASLMCEYVMRRKRRERRGN